MRIHLLVALSLAAACAHGSTRPGATSQDPGSFPELAPLMGTWVGPAMGEPGAGTGELTFAPELGGKALLRRSVTSFVATTERPAFHHDDLTVIFREADGVHALYLDNEGHVLRYLVTVSTADHQIAFVTEPAPGPRARLVYDWSRPGSLTIRFQLAPSDAPDSFATHVEGTMHRP